MKKQILMIFCTIFISVFFLTTCVIEPTEPKPSFDYDLWGTWVTQDQIGSIFKGEIKITYNSITIKGYGEDQTPVGVDDSRRPFNDIKYRNILMIGFNEETYKGTDKKEGIIYITESIEYEKPYVRKTFGSNPKTEILEFDFGGRLEVLVKKPEEPETPDETEE